MEIIIKPYSGLPCRVETFVINGIVADEDDFGEVIDDGAGIAEEYCCGNMRFHPKLPTQEVIDKYKITLGEYSIICGELDVLSVGACGWCS